MRRRQFLKALGTSLAAGTPLLQHEPAAVTDRQSRPPNILFIQTDDLGINDLACYGRREHRTPHLDRLASEGMRFLSAYCAQPICSPSRAAIMTGKTPARLHLTTYLPGRPDCVSQKLLHPVIRQQIPLEEKTVGEYLHEAGYATACIGKWHLGGQGFGPDSQGFDFVHAGKANTTPSATEGGKGEYDLTARAEEFLTAHAGRPFFLFLSHNSPHIPFTARQDLVTKNRDAFNPVYAAVIESLDYAVGGVLAHLEKLGLKENTLVIFTSDNGGLHVPEGPHEMVTHNAPFRAGKGYLYEGGLRIPLIVRWPGQIPAGLEEATPVTNTDWLPTLLDVAGIRIPADLDGITLSTLLRGRKIQSNRSFRWHFPHYNNQGGRPAGAIRKGDWKLIEYYDDQRRELYNLAQDPGEAQNLATRETGRAQALALELEQWRRSVGAQRNSPNPQLDQAWYQRLYVDVDASRYQPASATAEQRRQILEWRKGMDAVVAKSRI